MVLIGAEVFSVCHQTCDYDQDLVEFNEITVLNAPCVEWFFFGCIYTVYGVCDHPTSNMLHNSLSLLSLLTCSWQQSTDTFQLNLQT